MSSPITVGHWVGRAFVAGAVVGAVLLSTGWLAVAHGWAQAGQGVDEGLAGVVAVALGMAGAMTGGVLCASGMARLLRSRRRAVSLP